MKRRVFVAASILLSIVLCDFRFSLHAQESAQAVSKIREMGGTVVGLDFKAGVFFGHDGAKYPTPEIKLASENFDDRSLQLLGALKPTFKNPPSNFDVDRFLNRNRTSLTLKNTSVTDEGIAYLASGKIKGLNFTSIALINAHVTDEAVLSLAKISSLRTLDLTGCERLTDFRPLKELPNLSHLRLRNLPQLNANTLKPLADTMSLGSRFECSIDLSGCKDLDDKSIEALGEFKSLTSLNLNGCKNLSDEAFASLVNLPNLKEVNLGNCPQLKGPALLHLAKIRSLSRVSIGRCRFPISAIKEFSKRSGIRVSARQSKPMPMVDGFMNEWPSIFTLTRDAEPAAERPDGQIVDVRTVYSQNLNTSLFLKFEFRESVNWSVVRKQNREFLLLFDFGDKGTLTLDIVRNIAKLSLGGESKPIPMEQLEFDWKANASGTEHEMKVNFAAVGVKLSDSFVFDTSGEDRLYQPKRVKLVDRSENLGTPIHQEIQEGKLLGADSKTGKSEISSDLEQILGTWKAEIEYSRGKSSKLLQYLEIHRGGPFDIYVKRKDIPWRVWTEIDPQHQVMLQGDTHVHHERKIYKYFVRQNDLVVVELAYYQNQSQQIPPSFGLSKQDLKRIDKIIINESLRDFSKNLSMDILPELDFRTGSLKLESAEERPVTVTVYKREKPVSDEAKKKSESATTFLQFQKFCGKKKDCFAYFEKKFGSETKKDCWVESFDGECLQYEEYRRYKVAQTITGTPASLLVTAKGDFCRYQELTPDVKKKFQGTAHTVYEIDYSIALPKSTTVESAFETVVRSLGVESYTTREESKSRKQELSKFTKTSCKYFACKYARMHLRLATRFPKEKLKEGQIAVKVHVELKRIKD